MANRVYEAWKGNNIFFFRGRLIFGPDARSLIATFLLIFVPVVIFCSLVARNLLHRFTSYNAGYAIFVVTIIYTIWVLVLLLLTSARDPGIVPRNSHPPEEEFQYGSSLSVDGSGRPMPSLQLPRTKDIFVNDVPVRVKYCDTCMLYRPPRCSHCSICDNCVERFDHHCPWVGQCIGKRNYRYFFLFVSSLALLCIFIFSMSALFMKFLVDDYGTVWKATKESPASVILMAFCFVSFWFVGGLTSFHLYLTGKNQTTYENFRYRAELRRNAYDKGCMSNFQEVLCTKIEPSRNNFRAHVEDVPWSMTGPIRAPELDDSGNSRRAKVEDNLDIGDDILKISQHGNFEGIGDVRGRGSEGVSRRSPNMELGLGFEMDGSLSERNNSSLERRN